MMIMMRGGQGLCNAIYDSSMVPAHHFPPHKVLFPKFTYALFFGDEEVVSGVIDIGPRCTESSRRANNSD
jgi:hypothetical protein